MKKPPKGRAAAAPAHAEKYYEFAVDPGVPATMPTNALALVRFNWKRQRYLWRIQLVYKFMIFFLLTICIATWLFYFFARRKRCTTYKRCGWFHNYECSSRRFDFVTVSVFAESWLFLAQALLAILESSLLSVFLHTTMREVTQAASSTAGRLGCLTKYVPWVIAVFQILWLFSIGACLIFIAIGGCQKRFNADGLQAILNCRMYFSMCCSDDICGKALLPKDVHQCNSEHFLSAYGFFKNPIAIEVASQVNIRTLRNNFSYERSRSVNILRIWYHLTQDISVPQIRIPGSVLAMILIYLISAKRSFYTLSGPLSRTPSLRHYL
eukprot:Gregarina_sp_Pseudo_9__4760@NODE_496_length_2709_cov_30_744195_g468_i0_p1_GENE_NODE_496_length_2709_cov_30_744195_g468_i0NODE_496_length_2709_cov_30_744195_g468_i0_p1_ORF_typecomplete_len324_score2_00DER1/PF04511_15/1_1DER1/PF04511_15/1_2e03_NODE_496_length_2709_cov_30_744195_g468_i02041175